MYNRRIRQIALEKESSNQLDYMMLRGVQSKIKEFQIKFLRTILRLVQMNFFR